MNTDLKLIFAYYDKLRKAGKGLYGEVYDHILARKYKFTWCITVTVDPETDTWTYYSVYFKTEEDALNWIGVHEMTYNWAIGKVCYSEPSKLKWS